MGSDGHSVLGSAAVHNEAPRRQEYFIERELIETPLGLLTTVVGVQDFSGENKRLHLRGNFIHTLSTEHGLSAQLRLRYFHDSVPGESDYYAPGWYAQALPTLQLRRFVKGWRYAVAAGYGTQRDAHTPWRPAELLEASVTSPAEGRKWVFRAAFTYTNTPSNTGAGYDYRQLSMTLGRSF